MWDIEGFKEFSGSFNKQVSTNGWAKNRWLVKWFKQKRLEKLLEKRFNQCKTTGTAQWNNILVDKWFKQTIYSSKLEWSIARQPRHTA